MKRKKNINAVQDQYNYLLRKLFVFPKNLRKTFSESGYYIIVYDKNKKTHTNDNKYKAYEIPNRYIELSIIPTK